MTKIAKKTVKVNSKKKRYTINYIRVFLIICFIFFSFSFVKQQFEINAYNVQINSIQEDIDVSTAKTEELNELKNKVNDSEYMEKVAREELGLVKPYEKIFVDVDK